MHWYEAIFRTHGLSGAIADGIWTSRDNPPPYYGNAVTIAPSGVTAQLAILRDLGRVLGRPWAVKDSFFVLDLVQVGFQPLFDAEWIWRDPGTTPAPSDRHDISWRQVTTPAELDRWEAVWNANGSPTDSRVFLPAVLANETIALFAAHRGDTVIAGCAANRSADAVGFSNFFEADDDDLVVAGAIGEVARFGNGLPVVGYEGGQALARLLRLGFRSVGPLRVWITADATVP